MSPSRTSYGAAVAGLVVGAVSISFAPILVRLADTGPAAAGFWRTALALPVLAIAAMGARRSGGGGGPQAPSVAVLIAGAFFALDLGFWHYGIKLTTVANATILANLSPLVVTAVAWVLYRERPRRSFLVGMLLALAGVWAIASAKGGGGANPRLGDALSASTSIWYAAYMLIVRGARARQGTVQVMLWSTAASAPLLLVAALLLGEPVWPASTGGWMACLGLAAVHVTGQGSIAWALGRLPAPTASVVVLVQPVLAALLGWMIFAEPVGPQQMLGAGAALAGVIVAQFAAARSAREHGQAA